MREKETPRSETERALEKALRALAGRAHSEGEILEKLRRSGFEEADIAAVMEKLDRAGLLDDEAFAGAWASARARRGMGPRRIAHELRQKGVDSQTAAQALESVDEGEAFAAAVALAARYVRRGGENMERRALGALQRRGYGYGDARRALEQALAEAQENSADMR